MASTEVSRALTAQEWVQKLTLQYYRGRSISLDFFTPSFFLSFLKGTHRRRIPFKAQRQNDAGWGITPVRSLINISDSPVLSVKTEMTSHFNERGPKNGKTQEMPGDAEHEAGEHLIPWEFKEGTSLVMVTRASLYTTALGSFRKAESQG